MLPVFFWHDRRLSSAHTRRYESSDPDWYRRLVESENIVPSTVHSGPDGLTPCTPCFTSEHRNLREKVGPGWTSSLVPMLGGWTKDFSGQYHNGLMVDTRYPRFHSTLEIGSDLDSNHTLHHITRLFVTEIRSSRLSHRSTRR